jgi:acetolactate synthase I/III small subunit
LKKAFTIVIHTENTMGLLVRLTGLFSRRRIPILSLNVVAAEAESLYRFAIVIHETEEVTIKLIQQIDKQVEVCESFFHSNEEVC